MTSYCSPESRFALKPARAVTVEGHSQVAVGAIALTFAALATASVVPGGAFSHSAGAFDDGSAASVLMVAAPVLVAIGSALILGVSRIGDDVRALAGTLGGILVAAVAISGLATSFQAEFIGRVLYGVAFGGIVALGAALTQRVARATSVRRTTGLLAAGLGAGAVLAASATMVIGGLAG
jgi:predicted MFS family arabinose efflux permease